MLSAVEIKSRPSRKLCFKYENYLCYYEFPSYNNFDSGSFSLKDWSTLFSHFYEQKGVILLGIWMHLEDLFIMCSFYFSCQVGHILLI